MQESQTATHMVKNFQETVKIYQQAKKYYDALQSVNNLVRDARKVQQTVLMLGDISGYYVNNFKKMLTDPTSQVQNSRQSPPVIPGCLKKLTECWEI